MTPDQLRSLHIHELACEVIDQHADQIGTHYETCWQNHAACFATLIRDLIED